MIHRYIDQRNYISIIIHVAPQLDSKNESLSTLRLGSKVSQIELYPVQAIHGPSFYDSCAYTSGVTDEDVIQIDGGLLDSSHTNTPTSNSKLIESKVSTTTKGLV